MVALARVRNTGMKFSVAGDDLLEKGRGPVVMEPVRATVRLTTPRVSRVILLDHDGRRTGSTLPVTDGAFTLDGTRDRTPYYLVAAE